MLAVAFLFLLAVVAGVLSGVVGTGSSLLLLPALVWLYGPRVAVPVMGIPAAALGAHTLLTISGGAFLGTEAASSLLLYGGKLATFGAASALTGAVVIRGIVIGSALMFGSIAARPIVERVGLRTHAILIDIVLAVGAATMIAVVAR